MNTRNITCELRKISPHCDHAISVVRFSWSFRMKKWRRIDGVPYAWSVACRFAVPEIAVGVRNNNGGDEATSVSGGRKRTIGAISVVRFSWSFRMKKWRRIDGVPYAWSVSCRFAGCPRGRAVPSGGVYHPPKIMLGGPDFLDNRTCLIWLNNKAYNNYINKVLT